MRGKTEKEGSERKIGLFGGTFNPIHIGHLRGAEEIQEAFGLEEVIFIPAAIPPHKATGKLIDARHRLEMVKLATAPNPFFSTSDIELSRPGKSYSIDTIRYFHGKVPDALYFILGRDAFVEIETWKEYQNLFSLCHFIAMTRPGFQNTLIPSQLPGSLSHVFQYDSNMGVWIHPSGYKLYFKEITFLDISSTKIRELVEKGRSLRYLLPPEVEAYVQKHGLYRKRG